VKSIYIYSTACWRVLDAFGAKEWEGGYKATNENNWLPMARVLSWNYASVNISNKLITYLALLDKLFSYYSQACRSQWTWLSDYNHGELFSSLSEWRHPRFFHCAPSETKCPQTLCSSTRNASIYKPLHISGWSPF